MLQECLVWEVPLFSLQEAAFIQCGKYVGIVVREPVEHVWNMGALETPVPFGAGAGNSCHYSALGLASEAAEPVLRLHQHQSFVRVVQSH